MRQIHVKYTEKLDELQAVIMADFNFYNEQQSKIDLRLNELGRRGNIEETAREMRVLLEQREEVKDACLKLLPLRDFFRNNYPEVGERLARFAEFDR